MPEKSYPNLSEYAGLNAQRSSDTNDAESFRTSEKFRKKYIAIQVPLRIKLKERGMLQAEDPNDLFAEYNINFGTSFSAYIDERPALQKLISETNLEDPESLEGFFKIIIPLLTPPRKKLKVHRLKKRPT
ncbi:MAG: hypothetical protein COX80_00870 [Candidatus Magasanikbacteria bacterium CG_4_10_14_0_2_um_filter_33_14]|uniref:Uncharacterized protein n=1 Tax=Candidatus Magasanikbacteria bacterium CG_4_10_14_0_2_um_filter_33_14 TaxID=1974636 RepID=A0A2M7VBQ2_9BACT|nr:MAG: hypothetical protein COX80_00870 [Candidatus Magasanikbacteria bacterium CG_4_10_14_0_2_um_filter_33_14]